MKPNVLVLRSPGTNCDGETALAFEQAGASTELVHINRLIESPALIDEFQIMCFPGGFSYGDDIGAGRILASQTGHFLFDTISRFRDAGKLVLGICNGFQVLIKTGLLVAPDDRGFPVTLTWNDSGRYTCRWVTLRTAGSPCAFLRHVDLMYLPVAHAEGRFVTRDPETLTRLKQQRCVALRYVNGDGSNGTVPFPENPNGSDDNIAGICDPTGRVFGLMPHPERHMHPTQHPRWTREGLAETADGMQIFQNAVSHFAV
jgi:phosphoribosylformylglycinamidine synthase